MAIGYFNHPPFQTGLTSNDAWVNQILASMGYLATPALPILVTAQPTTIIPGQSYLIGAGSTYSVPGNIVIFLTNAIGSAVSIDPPAGYKMGKYICTGVDWVTTEYQHGSTVIYPPTITAPVVYTVPNNFDGICTVVVETTAGVKLVGAAGRSNYQLANTVLPVGIYRVSQSSTAFIVN